MNERQRQEFEEFMSGEQWTAEQIAKFQANKRQRERDEDEKRQREHAKQSEQATTIMFSIINSV